MNPTPLDIGIVSVAIALSSIIFGPEVSRLVGPYIVIVLASTIGASFALARREVKTRLNAMWFFFRINGLAVLLTVGAATVASSYYELLSEHVLLAPIAFAVGFVGDDWPALMRWVGSKINSLVDILIKLKGGGNG